MAQPDNNNLANRNHRSGFTLLELIVAIGIGAIVTLVLFQSLKIANDARNSTERAVAPARVAQVVMDMLRQDLQSMPPVASASTEGSAATLASTFTGTQSADDRGHEGDIIDFYTLSDGPLVPLSQAVNGQQQGIASVGSQSYGTNGNWTPASEIKAVEITIDVPQGTNDHCLVRKVWHNIAPLNQNQQLYPDQEEVICRNVESFTVRYFDGSEWQDSWDSTTLDNQLPEALEITVEIDRPVLSATDRNAQPLRYTQIIQIPCSNVANDTNVTGNVTGLSGGFGQ